MVDAVGGRSLVAALEEAGPRCTASEALLASLLQPFGSLSEHAVAGVLGMVARTSEGRLSGDMSGLAGGLAASALGDGISTWNVAVLVAGLQAAAPRLDWERVAAQLDQPGFAVPDAGALKLLMAAWARATGSQPFPLPALVGSLWTHAPGQLSFLRQATAAPPELFSWAHAARRLEPLEGLHGGKPGVGTPNHAWLCLDLLDLLARLADSGHAPAVRQLLELPLKQCPEVLLLGMAAAQAGWGPLQQEVFEPLVVTYVASHPNSGPVLARLWPLNRDALLRGMVSLYRKDGSNVARVLDVCQELRGLSVVLDATAPPFCIELAALASRREYLNLDKWLSDQFTAKGSSFMQAAVSFLDARLRSEQPMLQTAATAAPAAGVGGGSRINLAEATLEVFLRVLASNAGLLPSDTLQQFKMVQAAAVQQHPQLAGVVGDNASLEAFTPDIEEEANAYFQRVYAGEVSVEGLVEVLRGFKHSTLGREQEVFACMVHNLFDEYRFFPKYPDRELHTTALLFGQLIHHSLVSSVSLGIALRYVLEALRTGPGSKMFRFAVTALKQFAGDLSQWPQYCTHLTQVPGLKEAEPELYRSIDAAIATIAANGAAASAAAESAAATKAAEAAAGTPAKSREGNAAGFPTAMPATPSNPNALFSTINAETLEASAQNVSFPVPEDKVIDRVHFIINNITSMNIEQKVKELKGIVAPDYWPWFANYLVVKRAAQEPNFHATYVLLVDRWGERRMRDTLVATTVHYVRVMLASPKLRSITSERTLLKNLGAWLGKLTLANNRPVLQKQLDVKAVIVDAYEQGRMLAVLSFVRMLLEPAMSSRVFRPPNPWLMSILSLLVEVYHLDHLKTGLKFEVELLLKCMDMQLADVAPSTLLAGRRRESLDNADFQATRPASQGGAAPHPPPATAGTPSKSDAPAAAAAAAAADSRPAPPAPGPMIDPNTIANLHNYITISPQLAIVGERLQLKRLVPMAVDRAIVEIISPVVDRSVTIACMTAQAPQELVLKDHALEPEGEALRRSAHLMVTGLAQSLALVTAKEPLRIAVASNLRALLANQLDANMLEQVVAMLVADNLDLCCQVIEKAAGERAQREIDERLAGAYAARARAKAAGQPFVDGNAMHGRFPGALPDALRPRPGQLTPQQRRVYDDFARIPRTAAAAQQTAGAPRPAGALSQPESGEGGAPAAHGPGTADAEQAAAGGAAGQAPPPADLRSRFISWLQRMDLAVAKDPQAHFAALSDGSEVKVLVSEVAALPASEGAALEVAKNIFAKAYQGAASRLHVTAYCAALEVLREAALRRLPVELTAWFTQLPEEARFRKDVGEALLRGGLLYLPDLDLHLAKALSGPRYQAPAEFALHLVQACCVVEALASAADLAHTLDVLCQLATRVSGGNAVLQLVEEARRASLLRASKAMPAAPAAPPPPPEGPQDPPHLVEAIMKLFDRWARLLEEAPQERVHAPFVQELQQAGFLKGDDMTERFLRIMIQLAVQHCLRSEAAAAASMPPGAPRPAALSFVAVDAAVRLFACLITRHGGGPPLLSKVLGILAGVLQRDADERGPSGAFNGRPYFRACVGLLAELSPAEPGDEAGLQYLQAMAAFLYATRALKAPAFALPWLQLVADRRLLPRLLGAPGHRGWGSYLQLVLAQLRFLEPFLRNAELTDAVRLLYKGTLRLLLLLLHDFPEFLCHFHFHLCDAIPPSCIQMRNLVLSAFPRAMRLPDPFTPNLKVDLLPEIAAPPRFVPAPEALLPPQLRAEVDAFLAGRPSPSGAPPAAFLASLRARLSLAPADALACGTRYNVPLVNGLAFYVGARAVEASPPTPGTSPPMATPHMELFKHLLRDLDTEGRYLLLNALANHLRFPNAHTHYFSCALLALFTDAGSELAQEQITRVLLERLIVNRPHPWGLLITFIELIKNPRYAFWSHAFTRAAPEIERLFESVARSCAPELARAAPPPPGALPPQPVLGGAPPLV